MKLKDLAIKHPYYCSGSNYYSNDRIIKLGDSIGLTNCDEKYQLVGFDNADNLIAAIKKAKELWG